MGAKASSRGPVDRSIGRQRERDLPEFPGGDRSNREAAFRDLTQVGGDWAHGLQERALDVAKELRSQSDRAVGTVSQQVEHHPLASLGVAFAIGFVCASLIRR